MKSDTGNMVFNDWEITREIGSGASGTVYEIQKKEQGVLLKAALKVIHVPEDDSVVSALMNDGLDEPSVTQYLQGIVDELVEEIKIMVSVKGFPYIVNCEDYQVVKVPGEIRWDILIRMELLQPLQEYQKGRSLTEADVHTLAVQLAKALALMEEHGLIHRDIKPENIFVNPFGDYKLGDFGIAKVYDKTSMAVSQKGTRIYMAPEVYRGQEYDHTVDLYSLGLVLYRLLNKNRLPFYPIDRTYTAMESQRALTERMGGKKELPAPVQASEPFGRIILKMCAFRPESRYRSAKELLGELEQIRPSDRVVLEGSAAEKGEAKRQEQPEGENLTSVLFTGRTGSTGRRAAESKAADETASKRAGDKPDAGRVTSENAAVRGKAADEAASERAEDKPDAGRTASENAAVKGKAADEAIAGSAAKASGGRTTGRNYVAKTEYEADKSSEERKKKAAKKKQLMVGLALAAVVLAIAIPLYLRMKFTLTVNGGTGGGSYPGGAQVTVKADEVQGSSFAGWSAEGLELSADEKKEPELTFAMPRKSVVLTAKTEENTYLVSVVSGSGSGTYAFGDEVTIEAEAPQEGYAFAQWKIVSGSPDVKDVTSPKFTFAMGLDDVEVKAEYEPLTFKLKVEDASGSGEYKFGEEISLTAEEKANASFAGWEIEEGELPLSQAALKEAELEFSMPAGDVKLAAVYKTNEHQVTVNGGSGSGTYEVGALVEISADEPQEGEVFSAWKSLKGKPQIEEPSLAETSFPMPDRDVEIAAEMAPIEYSVTVNNGNGSGTYHLGDLVSISAELQKDGLTFSGWTVDEGDFTFSDPSLQNISFEMPAENLMLSAHYETTKYTLKVSGGKGSGMYSAGDAVSVTADAANAQGQPFHSWTVTKGQLDTKELDLTQPALAFSMPESQLELKANYAAAAPKETGVTLTVNGGSGSGVYAAGEKVTVTHDAPQPGMVFSFWIAAGYPGVINSTADSIEITMPESDVILTAVFAEQ